MCLLGVMLCITVTMMLYPPPSQRCLVRVMMMTWLAPPTAETRIKPCLGTMNKTVRITSLSVCPRNYLIVYTHNDLCVCFSDDDFIVDDKGRSVRQRKGDGTYAEP